MLRTDDAPELLELYEAALAPAQVNSDAPRWVLADALLEQGDPRGDFLAAQLSRP